MDIKSPAASVFKFLALTMSVAASALVSVSSSLRFTISSPLISPQTYTHAVALAFVPCDVMLYGASTSLVW